MKFGRYELREKLGAGAFGTVYRAYDEEVGREVALKIAPIQSDADAARLRREPRAAGQLVHPHIVPVFRAGVIDRKLYIASALIRGVTLQDWIEKHRSAIAAGTCDYRKIAVAVRKLADALAHAHERGVVHRDVKPSNILIDEKGEPYLTDFGLARLHESTSHATAEGTVLGTATYMSPEQAAGDTSVVGAASDQYSLGVVLYELLCGEPPFQGPPIAILYQIRHEQPPGLRGRRAPIPSELMAICEIAMAKDPRARFASLADMSNALADFVQQRPAPPPNVVPAAAPPPTVPALQETAIHPLETIRTGSPSRRITRGRRRDNFLLWLLGSVGAVALLTLGLALWWAGADRGAPSKRISAAEDGRRDNKDRGPSGGGHSNRHRTARQPDDNRADSPPAEDPVADESGRGPASSNPAEASPGKADAAEANSAEPDAAEADAAEANVAGAHVAGPPAGRTRPSTSPVPSPSTADGGGDAPPDGVARGTPLSGNDPPGPVAAAGDRNELKPPARVIGDPRDALPQAGDDPAASPHPLAGRRVLAVNALGALAAFTDERAETVRLKSFSAAHVAEALPALPGRTWTLAFSDTSRARSSLELATGGEDGVLRLWSIGGKQPEQTYASEKIDAEIFSVAFDNRGRPITGDAQGRLLRWDRRKSQPQQTLPTEYGSVYRLEVSPDGKTLISGHASGDVVRWTLGADDISAPIVLPQDEKFAGKSSIHALTFAPGEGGNLAAGGADGVIRQWETTNWRQRGLLHGPPVPVTALQYSPLDDRLLFSCGAEGVRMWVATHEDEWHALRTQDAEETPVSDFSLRNDGQLLLALGTGVRRWELRPDLQGYPFQLRAPARGWSHPRRYRLESIVFSPDGRSAAATSLHDPEGQNQSKVLALHLLNVASGRVEFEAPIRSGVGPRHSAFHPADPRILATGANDYRVYVWNLRDRSFAPLSDRLGRDVTCVAYSRTGELLVAGGYDAKVTILNSRTGAPLLPQFEKHAENALGAKKAEARPAYYASFLRDTAYVLSCCSDSVLLWKWDAQRRDFDVLRRWDHEKDLCYATLSTDGQYAIVGLRRSRLEIWDLREPEKVRAGEGKRVATLLSDATDFELSRGLALSEEGRFVATGQAGTGEICLWETRTGKRLLRFKGHERLVEQVAFSPGGSTLASCDELGGVVFLDIGSWHEVKAAPGTK